MAWNLDYSIGFNGFPKSGSFNRMLAGDGKLVWALMASSAGAADHSLWCVDASASYQTLPSADEDLAASRSGIGIPATGFQHIGYGATVASDGDTAYVGMTTVATTTYFDTIQTFFSWGVKGDLIKVPVRMNSNIVIDNGCLWMTTYDIDETGQQRLFRYQLSTKTWGSVYIPVRHQTEPRFIARDHDGHILVCDYNNLSISKFTNSGTYVSTTRLAASAAGANRQPNYITLGDDRQVYIASFQGMISKFDPNADTVTSFSNGLGDVHSFVDDGTYLWVGVEKRPMSVVHDGANYTAYESHMAGPTFDVEKWQAGGDGSAGAWTSGSYYTDGKEDLVRINKANNQIRHFGSSDRDIQIESPAGIPLVGVAVNSVLVTPTFSCSTKDGVITIPKLVWAITEENNVVAIPVSAMHRPNFYQMNAVAMMSFGPHDYIGE